MLFLARTSPDRLLRNTNPHERDDTEKNSLAGAKHPKFIIHFLSSQIDMHFLSVIFCFVLQSISSSIDCILNVL